MRYIQLFLRDAYFRQNGVRPHCTKISASTKVFDSKNNNIKNKKNF